MRRSYNNLNESFYYQIFNGAAQSANTPLNDASPIQQQMIQDKIAEMPTSLADRAKDYLRRNWKWLTVGAALLALGGAAYYNRDKIHDYLNPKTQPDINNTSHSENNKSTHTSDFENGDYNRKYVDTKSYSTLTKDVKYLTSEDISNQIKYLTASLTPVEKIKFQDNIDAIRLSVARNQDNIIDTQRKEFTSLMNPTKNEMLNRLYNEQCQIKRDLSNISDLTSVTNEASKLYILDSLYKAIKM